MKLYATVQVQNPPLKGIENQSFTLSDVLILLSLLVTLIGLGAGVWNLVISLIRLTNRANEIKSQFSEMDLKVVSKLDNLTDKVQAGFSYVEKRMERQERIIANLRARISDLERHLAKEGFVPRNPVEEA